MVKESRFLHPAKSHPAHCVPGGFTIISFINNKKNKKTCSEEQVSLVKVNFATWIKP